MRTCIYTFLAIWIGAFQVLPTCLCETLALFQGDISEESVYQSNTPEWSGSLGVPAVGSLDSKTCFCEEGHCKIAEPIREQLLDLDLAEEGPLVLWSGFEAVDPIASQFSGRLALPPDRFSTMRAPSRALLVSFIN